MRNLVTLHFSRNFACSFEKYMLLEIKYYILIHIFGYKIEHFFESPHILLIM